MSAAWARLVEQALRPIRTRVINMVARSVVKAISDSGKLQVMQLSLMEDETREGVERFQNYGFTSHPLPGAEAVVAFVGGNRDHGLIVAVDDRRYRLNGLTEGEVAVYTDQGDSIVIRRGGTIEVTASTKVKVDAPAVELSGSAQAAVLGTAYRAAEDTLLTALSAAFGKLVTAAIPPTGGPMIAASGDAAVYTAAVTAISTFQAAAATYLSTKVKLG